MVESFTSVEIAFYPEFVNDWLRFGEPDVQLDLDRRRSLSLFKPRRVFGYVRWRANEYGTLDWRFTIVQSGGQSLPLSRMEGVSPGGKILLQSVGNARVKRALRIIDTLESEGFEPAKVSPAYYRHTHNRISVGRPVLPYSNAEHRAHLAAQAVLS